jgi:hypothetical protein
MAEALVRLLQRFGIIVPAPAACNSPTDPAIHLDMAFRPEACRGGAPLSDPREVTTVGGAKRFGDFSHVLM